MTDKIDYIAETKKHLDHPNLLADECTFIAKNFIIEPEINAHRSDSLEFNLGIDYDFPVEFIPFISFLWDYKKQELAQFIENIRKSDFAVFDNISGVSDKEPYYDDYPEKMIVYPADEKRVRFIMIDCYDWIAETDESLTSDMLVDKNMLIDQLEKAYAFMEQEDLKDKKKK